MAEGSDVALCRSELNIFLKYRDFIQHEDMQDVLTLSITQILESGWSAFKVLGFPGYYDDFICLYHCILNSSNLVPLKIKKEMRRILHDALT